MDVLFPLPSDTVALVAERHGELRKVPYETIRRVAQALIDEGLVVPASFVPASPAHGRPRDGDRVTVNDGRMHFQTSVVFVQSNDVVIVLGGDGYRSEHVTVTDRAYYESELRTLSQPILRRIVDRWNAAHSPDDVKDLPMIVRDVLAATLDELGAANSFPARQPR
jgi:hypothetical protein